MARETIGSKNFFLIYIRARIEECMKRDPKLIYQGEKTIKNMTGIDQVFEKPTEASLVIDTENSSIEDSSKVLLNFYKKNINHNNE